MGFMRSKLLFLPFLIAIVGLSMMGERAPVQMVGSAKADGPVVVELFTSQSCSSCPPADALLGELAARDTDIIAFSCHVTYWDHLNWRDTMSLKACTNRQRAYAGFMGKRQVYTPQMVVNGEHEFVGSNRAEAARTISTRAVAPIQLTLNGEDIAAALPALPPGTPKQTLWLLSYKPQHTQDIPSGENRGRTISYTNSVLTLDQVGVWDGHAAQRTFKKPQSSVPDAGYALIAQPQDFGTVSAAGKL